MKKIIVLGANESSYGIIKTIAKMGFFPVVFSYNKNQSKPPFAEFFYYVQENNVEEVVRISKELKVDGIVPIPVDRPLKWMSLVAEELGLIFIPARLIKNFRDKYAMKSCLLENMIPTAKGMLTSKDSIENETFQNLQFPLIVKPPDQYASRGVSKVNNEDELIKFAKEAIAFSDNGKIIIEEFIEGREFNAEGVCYDGDVEIYAIVEKISGRFPRTIEMGHIIPPLISKNEEKIIIDIVTRAVKALGLKNGAFNTEVKINGNKAYIIEVNGRLAGDFIISHLIKPTTGQDMEKNVVNISLGVKPEKGLRNYINHGLIKFFNLPPNKRIKRINNLNTLKNIQGVIKIHLFYKEGDLVPIVEHMGHRSGFIIVLENSRERLFKLADDVIKQIFSKIEYY
jgi:biotin carboxylase